MTTWSGLFNDVHNDGVASSSAYTVQIGKLPIRGRVNILFRASRTGVRKIREKVDTLLGAAVGGAAADSYSRVQAPTPDFSATQLGGVRTIETRTIVSGNTTSADLTDIKSIFQNTSLPSSYPTDPSGNGGGNKGGRI